MAFAVCITGPLKDAKLLVETLKYEQTDLYVESLQLFECIHLTFFDKDVYKESNKFIVDYICDVTKATTFNDNSYTFSLENNGLQTDTMLQNIKTIVSSSSSSSFISKKIKYEPNNKVYSKYDAYYDEMRSRTLINSNEKLCEML